MRKLELGCGTSKKEGFDGADIINYGQKWVFDATKSWPVPSASYDYILAENLFEHLEPGEEIITCFNECYRVLTEGGILEILVPRWPHPNLVADPTHKSMYDFVIEEDKVMIFIFRDKMTPRQYFHEKSFEYWAGKRPRGADYGIKKWAIENDGKGNYTWEIREDSMRVRLVKGRQK